MARIDVQIPAPDGQSNGTLHVPDGDGPWPGVVVFPDAGGARETMREVGDRLAEMGYVALVPDIFYRAGEWAPFDMATAFSDSSERTRMFGMIGELTNDDGSDGAHRIAGGSGPDRAARRRPVGITQ